MEKNKSLHNWRKWVLLVAVVIIVAAVGRLADIFVSDALRPERKGFLLNPSVVSYDMEKLLPFGSGTVEVLDEEYGRLARITAGEDAAVPPPWSHLDTVPRVWESNDPFRRLYGEDKQSDTDMTMWVYDWHYSRLFTNPYADAYGEEAAAGKPNYRYSTLLKIVKDGTPCYVHIFAATPAASFSLTYDEIDAINSLSVSSGQEGEP